MADFVRELLIKLGLVGGAETRAEIDATAASVEKMGVAGKDAGAAAETSAAAQAAALKGLEDSLSRAANVQTNFQASVKQGASEGALAQKALADAIATVEAAMNKVRAAGALVPDASVQSLDKMKLALANATKEIPPHVDGVQKVAKGHGDAKIQTDLWRDALGRTGNTISALSESTNPLIAAIGKFLLPLGAAAIALGAFNKVAGELKERGVDISTIGDRWSGVMDTLAIALGGTSKTMSGMVSEMAKTQAAYTGLDESQKSYSTGLALMEAAQATAGASLKLFASVANEIPPDLAAMGGGLDNVGVKARVALSQFEDLNKQLNVIRTTNPQLADSFTQQLTALSSLGVGTEKYNAELGVLKPQIAAAAKDSENWAQVMKAAAGGSDEAAKGLARLTTESKLLDVALTAGHSLHLSDAEIFKAMGPLVQKVAQDYAAYGSALRVTNPVLAAVADAASKSKSGLDGMSTALKQSALDSEKAAKEYQALVNSIISAGKASGDYRAAAAAEHSELDSRIVALERQKNTILGLNDAQKSELNNLLAIHAAISRLTPEEEKHAKAQEDGLKKAHDLSKSYEDLTKARDKDREAIEKHREDFIAALDAELAKSEAATAKLVSDIQARFKAGEISNTEYFQSINEAYGKQAEAHRAAMEKEDEQNREAARKEAEAQKKYEEQTGELARQAAEQQITSLVQLKEKQAEYDVKVTESLAKIRGEWQTTSSSIEDRCREINVSFDGMIAKLSNVVGAIKDVNSAASATFGDVTSSSSSTAPSAPDFGDVTSGSGSTAPEPPLFAPGGET